MQYLSVFSTLITFIFAAAVFNRYFHRKGTHLLFWGVGLLFYGLGTFMGVLMLFSFSGLALKLWYLSGAMLTAAWLGQGTLNLLVRRRGIAQTLNIALLAISLVAVFVVSTAPLTGAGFDTGRPASEQYQAILSRSGLMIALTVILNIYGTLALVGGALYSAFIFWRKQVLLNRVIGNIFIACGALLPAMAGSFIRAGLVDWHYLSELLGVTLMYLGFVQATSHRPVPFITVRAGSSQ